MSQRKSKKLLYILPVLAGCLWGSVGIFVRELTACGMDNSTILFARNLPGAIVLFVLIMIKNPRALKTKPKDIWLYPVCAVVGMVCLNITYNNSLNNLTMSFAAVLMAMSPVYVLLLAAPIFKEKITKRKVFCIILAIFGCMLVSGLIGSGGEIKWTAFGLTCGIISGFCYGCYSIFSKMASNRNIDPLTFVFFGICITVVIFAPFTSFDVIGRYLSEAPARHMLFLLCPALLNVIFPYLLYNYSLERGEVGPSSLLAAASEPMAATVFGFILYSERPTVFILIGLGITILALVLITMGDDKKKCQEHT